jgi:hypothetical protein
MTLPRLMKAHDAAIYLGISTSKLRQKNLPTRRDGGNILYDRLDLDEYADSLPYDGKQPPQEDDEWQRAFG